MLTTYRMKATELDQKFLRSVKAQFRNKEIEIVISEYDETEYLLKSEANKECLLQSIENIRKGVHLHKVNLDELDENSNL